MQRGNSRIQQSIAYGIPDIHHKHKSKDIRSDPRLLSPYCTATYYYQSAFSPKPQNRLQKYGAAHDRDSHTVQLLTSAKGLVIGFGTLETAISDQMADGGPDVTG